RTMPSLGASVTSSATAPLLVTGSCAPASLPRPGSSLIVFAEAVGFTSTTPFRKSRRHTPCLQGEAGGAERASPSLLSYSSNHGTLLYARALSVKEKKPSSIRQEAKAYRKNR